MTIPSSVQDLCFVDNFRGFAACTSGRAFKTTDSGGEWMEMSTPVLCD